jgi:hypothetical protein
VRRKAFGALSNPSRDKIDSGAPGRALVTAGRAVVHSDREDSRCDGESSSRDW